MKLFRRIHQLRQTELLYKISGKPKRPSDQFVADQLNDEGWGNINGDPFNRKSINRIRRSEAFRILVEERPGLPNLGQ